MAKTRQEKEQMLQAYQDVVANEDFVLLKTYSVPAASLTILRKQLGELNASIYILKNRLFKIAAQDSKDLADIPLEGNHALVTAGDDITEALKLVDAAKKMMKDEQLLKVENPEELAKYVPYTYEMGYINGSLIDGAGVQRLKDLPPREAILGQLAGLLNAPLTGFMNVLQGNIRDFTYALNDLQKQKANQ